jgi:hypothetical protein
MYFKLLILFLNHFKIIRKKNLFYYTLTIIYNKNYFSFLNYTIFKFRKPIQLPIF